MGNLVRFGGIDLPVLDPETPVAHGITALRTAQPVKMREHSYAPLKSAD